MGEFAIKHMKSKKKKYKNVKRKKKAREEKVKQTVFGVVNFWSTTTNFMAKKKIQ